MLCECSPKRLVLRGEERLRDSQNTFPVEVEQELLF